MLEVEEQPVHPGGRHLDGEVDGRSGGRGPVSGVPVGMHVQVGEIRLPERDQVPVRLQIGIEIGDGTAVPGHRGGEGAGLTGADVPGEPDLVPVDPGRPALGRRRRLGPERARHGQIGAEGQPVVTLGDDIGEHPVGPGRRGVHRGGPHPGGLVEDGVQVLEARQVAAHHDQVELLAVGQLVRGHGSLVRAGDQQPDLGGRVRRGAVG